MSQSSVSVPIGPIVTRAMGDGHILERCLAGEIIIVENFLETIGWSHRIKKIIGLAISEHAGESVATEISKNGFEHMHRFVSVTDAQKIVKTVEHKLSRLSPLIHYSLLGCGIIEKKPLWVLRNPLLRIHYPFDATWGHRKSLQKFRSSYGEGRMTPLRPHRDSWFSEPKECINIWVSITSVSRGNSLCLFPETYGMEMPFSPSRGVLRTQFVGRAESIEMSSGGALFFHAEHLHASELNSTDQTRCTLSLRVSTTSPRETSKDPGRYSKINPAHPWTYISLHPYWKSGIRKVGALKSKLSGARKAEPYTTPLSPIDSDAGSMSYACIEKISITELEIDRPRPLSEDRCIVRLQDDSVLTFNRRCPHQGADLSLSNVEGFKLRCPWHNLEFDLQSGKCNCVSITDLKVRQCTIKDGLIDIHSSDVDARPHRI